MIENNASRRQDCILLIARSPNDAQMKGLLLAMSLDMARHRRHDTPRRKFAQNTVTNNRNLKTLDVSLTRRSAY
jgi:indole-3-glycerol phosphate synthase